MSKIPSYVKSTLGKGEEIKWVADLHWVVWFGPVGWLLIGFIFCFSPAAWFGYLLVALCTFTILKWKKTEYVVTNLRVIAKSGIIAVKTEELRNTKVESVFIQQGFFERIFGCGTVVFGGTGGSKVLFRYIRQPRQVKTILEEIIEESNAK